MFVPHHQSHRVALVFYQTDLKVEDDEPAGKDGAGDDAPAPRDDGSSRSGPAPASHRR